MSGRHAGTCSNQLEAAQASLYRLYIQKYTQVQYYSFSLLFLHY